MLKTVRGFRGAVTSPHHAASHAGLNVLREGGNALEAAIATAAAIAVVYPHMNGLGGDNFWLIKPAGRLPIGIDACGAAAKGVNAAMYREAGHTAIPSRGGQAALTVAGAVAGWQEAYALAKEWGGRLPLPRLLEEAIHYARDGFAVTDSQYSNTINKRDELRAIPGFSNAFLADDGVGAPIPGSLFRNPALATTIECLAHHGLEDFYRGDLAHHIADELSQVGSPLGLADLDAMAARRVTPLQLNVNGHALYNLPPPTQGLASLMILGLFSRLEVASAEGFEFVHALVEATKCAFRVRDREIGDPAYMTCDPKTFLESSLLDQMAGSIDRGQAASWPDGGGDGDTVWFGAVDSDGNAVSCIQSLYWEFGSGVVLSGTGLTWQNRGISFSLDSAHHNQLIPGRKPFHTIQPALACLDDGRVMVYGTMGGDGQPQTQAALFCRYALYGYPLQAAVTAPRWLLGRTWGESSTHLKIESRFPAEVIASLHRAGHDVQRVAAFDEMMGHAGALCHHPNGLIEGASDPRSDGQVATF